MSKQDKSRPWAGLFGDKPVQKSMDPNQGQPIIHDAVAHLPNTGASDVTVKGTAPQPVPSGDLRSPDHVGVLAQNQFGPQTPQVGNDPNVVGTRYVPDPTISQVYAGSNTPSARAQPVKPEVQP